MNESVFRGGNSRSLGRAFDQLPYPAAVLDRRGSIVFVNRSLCEMAGADSRQLTGLQCHWEIAADGVAYGSILTALAPPAGALEGKLVARQLTAPVVFGSTATGQLFVPLVDEEHVPQVILVVLGDWGQLQQLLPRSGIDSESPLRRTAERMLVQLRSQWRSLDQLLTLVGESPTIGLAMSRAQLAVASDCHCWITGPSGSGTLDVISGIHLGRLRRLGIPEVRGHWMPLDCAALTADLFEAMLEVFEGRLKTDLPAATQLLVLEHIESLSPSSASCLIEWLREYGDRCAVGATSSLARSQLLERGDAWNVLTMMLAAVEIDIAPLRERPMDIPVLSQHLLSAACRRQERAQLTLAPQTLDLLVAFPWPGNLRQLAEAIDTAVRHAVLTASIQPQHLPVEIRSYASRVHEMEKVEPIILDHVLEDVERTLIRRALQLSPRNRAQSARLLGISRPRLLRRIEQLGLTAQQEEDTEDTEQ